MTIPREQTRQNYDRMSRWYDLFAASERRFTESGLHILGVKSGDRVLEIGFGTGKSLVALAQRVGNSGLVAGLELSPGMIEVARKRMQTNSRGQKRGDDPRRRDSATLCLQFVRCGLPVFHA